MSPLIAGVDEAGRGPLAGPVIAAAVVLDDARPIPGLKDSKLLSAAQRARLADSIRTNACGWAVGEASVEEIDRLNILQATLLAMRRALAALGPRPTDIMIDGNIAPQLSDMYQDCLVVTVVQGDRTVPAISAASIIAKTYRDGLMSELDRRHPGYGLAQHQGYPTALHLEALRRLGPSDVHRRSFGPVRSLRR